MKIVGFILSRNNGNLLEKAIKKCPKCIDEIFISDDKSNDNTHEVAEKNGFKFLQTKKLMDMEEMLKMLLRSLLKILMLIMQLKFMVMVHNFILMQLTMH